MGTIKRSPGIGAVYADAVLVEDIASTNAYQATAWFDVSELGLSSKTIDVYETGGVNGITYKVEAKQVSTPSGLEKTLETPAGVSEFGVAAGAAGTQTITDTQAMVRVSFKSTVAGSHGAVTVVVAAMRK